MTLTIETLSARLADHARSHIETAAGTVASQLGKFANSTLTIKLTVTHGDAGTDITSDATAAGVERLKNERIETHDSGQAELPMEG